jgi:tRNA pseudouridine38-40 synthase
MTHRRVRLIIEYVGTNYCGWQMQENGLSIQAVVTEAVRTMAGHAVTIVGASRTDSGVHALGQVAHFDTSADIPDYGFLRGLNSILPPDIRMIDVSYVDPTFHAQRDAQSKWYRYMIMQAPHASAVLAHRSWHRFRELDVDVMNVASQHLVGRHDFSAYCAYDDQNRSKVRTVLSIHWEVIQESVRKSASGAAPLSGRLITCDVQGKGFLKQMVRNMVGTIVEVGEGRRSPDSVLEALQAQKRSMAGVCAPPDGLFLMKVHY